MGKTIEGFKLGIDLKEFLKNKKNWILRKDLIPNLKKLESPSKTQIEIINLIRRQTADSVRVAIFSYCYYILRQNRANKGKDALYNRKFMLEGLSTADEKEYAKRLDNIVGTIDTEGIFRELKKRGMEYTFLDLINQWIDNIPNILFINYKMSQRDIKIRIELKFDVDLVDYMIILGRGKQTIKKMETAAYNFLKQRKISGEKYQIKSVNKYLHLHDFAKSVLIERLL